MQRIAPPRQLILRRTWPSQAPDACVAVPAPAQGRIARSIKAE